MHGKILKPLGGNVLIAWGAGYEKKGGLGRTEESLDRKKCSRGRKDSLRERMRRATREWGDFTNL